MGKILQLKNKNAENVEVTLELSQREIEKLSGNMNKIHLFSEENLNIKTKVVQRGRRESTKYFLMPKEFRKDIRAAGITECSKIETKNRNLYIFAVDKII